MKASDKGKSCFTHILNQKTSCRHLQYVYMTTSRKWLKDVLQMSKQTIKIIQLADVNAVIKYYFSVPNSGCSTTLHITPTPVQPSDDHRRGKMTPALQGPQKTPALDYKQSLNLLNCVLYVFT